MLMNYELHIVMLRHRFLHSDWLSCHTKCQPAMNKSLKAVRWISEWQSNHYIVWCWFARSLRRMVGRRGALILFITLWLGFFLVFFLLKNMLYQFSVKKYIIFSLYSINNGLNIFIIFMPKHYHFCKFISHMDLD